MPTIYERLLVYCQRTGDDILAPHQRSSLGYNLFWELFKYGIEVDEFPRAESTEDDGIHNVRLYPDDFTDLIDRRIEDAYKNRHIEKKKPKKAKHVLWKDLKKRKRERETEALAKPPSTPPPIAPKKERKRIPINKPLFTSRPTNSSNG